MFEGAKKALLKFFLSKILSLLGIKLAPEIIDFIVNELDGLIGLIIQLVDAIGIKESKKLLIALKYDELAFLDMVRSTRKRVGIIL